MTKGDSKANKVTVFRRDYSQNVCYFVPRECVGILCRNIHMWCHDRLPIFDIVGTVDEVTKQQRNEQKVHAVATNIASRKVAQIGVSE